MKTSSYFSLVLLPAVGVAGLQAAAHFDMSELALPLAYAEASAGSTSNATTNATSNTPTGDTTRQQRAANNPAAGTTGNVNASADTQPRSAAPSGMNGLGSTGTGSLGADSVTGTRSNPSAVTNPTPASSIPPQGTSTTSPSPSKASSTPASTIAPGSSSTTTTTTRRANDSSVSPSSELRTTNPAVEKPNTPASSLDLSGTTTPAGTIDGPVVKPMPSPSPTPTQK